MNTIMGEHWDLTVEGGFGDRVSPLFNFGYRFRGTGGKLPRSVMKSLPQSPLCQDFSAVSITKGRIL